MPISNLYLPVPTPRVYVTEKEFHPKWFNLDTDGIAMCEGLWAAPIGDLVTPLVFADWLQERGDDRHLLLRRAVEIEQIAMETEYAAESSYWSREYFRDCLWHMTQTDDGWLMSLIYGVMCVRWLTCDGNSKMHQKWTSKRVEIANRWVLMKACGLVCNNPLRAATYIMKDRSVFGARRCDVSAANYLVHATRNRLIAAENVAESLWDLRIFSRSNLTAGQWLYDFMGRSGVCSDPLNFSR